jgi:N-acetylglutamate synthase-like GNAT family acetyltransferase
MGLHFSEEIPHPDQLYDLYESVGWNDFLHLSKGQLVQALTQSWYVINVYDDKRLIGTGRLISDGVINANLCGLVVHPDYQGTGIGKFLVKYMVDKSKKSNLYLQLYCRDELIAYYEKLGFQVFAAGMKYEGLG